MNRRLFGKITLFTAGVCILLPVLLLALWSVTGRWPWPALLPESWTLRTLRELLFGYADLPGLLWSSVLLAGVTALSATLVALLTARATQLYDLKVNRLVGFLGLLPLLIPGAVFAIGIQQVLLRLGLNDTLTGVLLVHLISALPYSIAIMNDITAGLGDRLEEQAAVLGASPVQAFWYGSLPGLLPGILSSVSMAFILSYSQYFTTLIVGGGRVKTLSLVLVPYIQSGDRALASVYSLAFVGSALLVFFLLEGLIVRLSKGGKSS